MKVHSYCLSLKLATLTAFTSLAMQAPAAHAAAGLVPPAAAAVWPQWQARISVQAASVSPLTVSGLFDGGSPARGLQGGAVLGDYYFGAAGSGSGFRASGGLLSGPLAGLPLASAMAGPRLGVSVNQVALPANSAGIDGPATLPYLGLGYSGGAGFSGLSISADLGLVAGTPGTGLGGARAVFGNQGNERTLRELRLSPLLQFSLRYAF